MAQGSISRAFEKYILASGSTGGAASAIRRLEAPTSRIPVTAGPLLTGRILHGLYKSSN